MKEKSIYLLDCTLRDGGYYNSWDFPEDLVIKYLDAMVAAGADAVELGMRSLNNRGFKGAYAYTTDSHLRTLHLDSRLVIAVMVNGSELVGDIPQQEVLARLFPVESSRSPVDLVRIACHVHEFSQALTAAIWLKERGYMVGFNLMQVAECDEAEITTLARLANEYPLDMLYFADSMGSMNPAQTQQIVSTLRAGWSGPLGIHTHDNQGLALSNTLCALQNGVTWIDSTVTGMGRGPGNARTEELAIELAEQRGKAVNLVPLMAVMREHFLPLKTKHCWGTNPYYYLAGKYGIHPTYIQQMLGDSRYDEEDIIAVINHLRNEGGKKFDLNTLAAAREFFGERTSGNWSPIELFRGREVLLLGSGSGAATHRGVLERYIHEHKPLVVALNTQCALSAALIDVRFACHPVRLLADYQTHLELPQPLITPFSMLPDDVRESLDGKQVFDFGLNVDPGRFHFGISSVTVPASLVVAYALSTIASGKATRILMAGFDGYGADDPRNHEMNELLKGYSLTPGAVPILAVTPSKYELESKSIYGLAG